MSRTKTIEVDVIDAYAAEWEAQRFEVGFEIVTLTGPGGGNPLVRLRGEPARVNRLLAYWGYDKQGRA